MTLDVDPPAAVTGSFSKSLAVPGFRVGYAVLPERVAARLNASNDAYPLARPSQAAAIATLDHHQKIERRIDRLRSWADQLASELESVGVTTFPSQTYFFLADVSPHDADEVAAKLREQNIFIKPLGDERLGAGYLRVTTARPEDNERVVEAFREIL